MFQNQLDLLSNKQIRSQNVLPVHNCPTPSAAILNNKTLKDEKLFFIFCSYKREKKGLVFE